MPALPSGEKQTLCCARCGEAICADPQKTADGDGPRFRARENETVPFIAMSQPPAYDSWELDEQLQHIDRVLHAGNTTGGESEAVARRQAGDCPDFRVNENGTVPFSVRAARFDPPQADLPARHFSTTNRPGKRRKKAGRRGAVASLLTWFVFTLGIGSSACGGILLGWSLATGRQELWNVGMPVALVGRPPLAR